MSQLKEFEDLAARYQYLGQIAYESRLPRIAYYFYRQAMYHLDCCLIIKQLNTSDKGDK